jgi:tetratricopeptide (TPR) repeat protein
MNLKKMQIHIHLIIVLLFCSSVSFAQVDIVSTLQHIENNEFEEAKNDFKRFNDRYPKDANVQFLAAVLTENGDEALNKYTLVFTNFPNSQFADAALYRVFSYYYSLGIYSKAEQFLTKLKKDYPNSPYIKVADRTLPSEDFFEANNTENSKNIKNNQISNVNEYKFTIQAGAFLNKTTANNLKDKYEKKGIYAKTYTKDVGGSTLNVVNIGKFINQDSSQELLDELKKDFNLIGRVVPFN